ncbi:MAG: hypothetical protein N4A41_13695 [Crocinitomicaceae bacterium]|jgi:TolB-like protein|nr:hypothetical protein [Crocinitomicaceae bacterium]
MMKTQVLKAVMIGSLFVSGFVKAQDQGNSLNSIAIANPHVEGLSASKELVAKMMRLEVIKTKKFNVYDEFDMSEVVANNKAYQESCYGKSCLVNLGRDLGVQYILGGSVDAFYQKIAVSFKVIDIKNGSITKSVVKEFDNQEQELQRMIEISIREIFDLEVSAEVAERLLYRNDLITPTKVGKINNSGPRVGYAYAFGDLYDFATRSEASGGLGALPAFAMIGYQFEAQYVGNDKFSALIEGIVNVSGLEQGLFIPTFTLMNGFRFENTGWEFAFGPGLGVKKMRNGFLDNKGLFGQAGRFYGENDWNNYVKDKYGNDPNYQDTNGYFIPPSPSDFDSDYSLSNKVMHSGGNLYLSTSFVFALGKTFRAGSLNIPVNLFYSAQRRGGMVGLNVGFNVQKSRSNIPPIL